MPSSHTASLLHLARPARASLSTVLIAASVCGLSACSGGISDKSLTYIPPIEVDQVLHPPATLFTHPEPGVWVDPRLKAAYEAGHIPGAINIPFPEMLDTAKQLLAGDGSIIVYDTNYDDILGKAGAKRLLEMGFKNVYNLQGGLEAWKQQGHPVVTGPNPMGTAPSGAPTAAPTP